MLHLHGELNKAQSTADPSLIYDVTGKDINLGDLCEKGSQLRPFVVWFGEPVPAMEEAVALAGKADIFAVIGSSLVVYPAAGLLEFVPEHVPVFVVDPNEVTIPYRKKVVYIKEKASKGVKILKEKLLSEYA